MLQEPPRVNALGYIVSMEMEPTASAIESTASLEAGVVHGNIGYAVACEIPQGLVAHVLRGLGEEDLLVFSRIYA